jgi:hypothetical protein
VTGQWVVVVQRIMNGTGVLKVYLIQTKKYAYRLHFVRASAPEWVLEALKEIHLDATIWFEEETDDGEGALNQIIREIEAHEEKTDEGAGTIIDEENEVHFIGNEDKQTVIMQLIKGSNIRYTCYKRNMKK